MAWSTRAVAFSACIAGRCSIHTGVACLDVTGGQHRARCSCSSVCGLNFGAPSMPADLGFGLWNSAVHTTHVIALV